MDKKVINEEQFRKLVIAEAKKFISEEGEVSPIEEVKKPETKRKVTFDKVETLIKEMEGKNKSIASLSMDVDSKKIVEESAEEVKGGPNRDLDVVNHNKNKNIIHVNEGEKDKWNRMLNYKIPSDNER